MGIYEPFEGRDLRKVGGGAVTSENLGDMEHGVNNNYIANVPNNTAYYKRSEEFDEKTGLTRTQRYTTPVGDYPPGVKIITCLE